MTTQTQPPQALDKKIDNYFEEELMDSMADVQGEVKTIIRQHIQSFLKKAKEELEMFSDQPAKKWIDSRKDYVLDTLAKGEFGSLVK